MCGLAGMVGAPTESGVARVRAMIDALQHRGPDDSGVEVLDSGRVVLGHRRLSILDLSPAGHQPMATADGAVWIVFNGEIYNFREVRAELEKLGCSFRTESDTEVVLEAYRRWGLAEAVGRFHGMFALALWDGNERKLHLCRDRFGVKPLFYCRRGPALAFGSELRALAAADVSERSIDPRSAAHFLRFGYFSEGMTIFADVEAVSPGTIVTFDADLASHSTRYWSVDELFAPDRNRELRMELDGMPEEALLDRVEDSLTKAFQYRMVADVPVGLFLSGGIDSSIVAAVLARRAGLKLRTFTIGYGASDFDEMPYARDVASRLGTEHTELLLSGSQALEVVSRLPTIVDEPIGNSSIIPTYLVSELARRHVTVALSADGADELFGGYARYRVCGRHARSGATRMAYRLAGALIEHAPPEWLGRAYAWSRGGRAGYAAIEDKLRKFARMASSPSAFEAYESAVSECSAGDARSLLDAPGPGPVETGNFMADSLLAPEEQFMRYDAARYLPGDLLTKLDRASMSVSLEAREPFLDQELARLAAALPLRWKIREGQSKYALRRILARHLPPGLFDRPKQGFSVPIAEWMRGPLRELVTDELSPQRVRRIGILDDAAVQSVLRDFLEGGSRASPASLWFILQLQQWAGHWMTPSQVTWSSCASGG